MVMCGPLRGMASASIPFRKASTWHANDLVPHYSSAPAQYQ